MTMLCPLFAQILPRVHKCASKRVLAHVVVLHEETFVVWQHVIVKLTHCALFVCITRVLTC